MNIQSANSLLKDRITAELTESKQMVDGDLWLDGKGLIVKKPTDQTTLNEMFEDFNSQNALSEVTERRVDGVLGREPQFAFARKDGEDLSDAETAKLEEMYNAVVENWYNSELLLLNRDVYRDALSQIKNCVRPFVPSSYKGEDGEIIKNESKNFDEVLKGLYFERVSPENAGVFIEENTQKPFSLFKTTIDGKIYFEYSFTDGDNVTHYKRFRDDAIDDFLTKHFPTLAKNYGTRKIDSKVKNNQERRPHAIDLDGKLFLYELDLRKPFITEAMKRNQKGISLAKTMKGRNTYTAGFRERHWLGAERPLKKITDPNDATKEIYIPEPLKLGPTSSTFTQGALVYDNENRVIGRANASLVVVDPVDTETFIKAKGEDYYSILAQAHQTHILASDKANLSGISRRESRSDHEKALKGDKVQLDALGRYEVEFMVAFAAAITGREKEFEPYRIDFNCIVDAGMLTPEEKEDNRKAYLAGEIKLSTLQSRNGVEDTDAETSGIKAEDGYELNLISKAAEAYANAGGQVPFAVFVSMLPFEDEKKNEIISALQPNNNNE